MKKFNMENINAKLEIAKYIEEIEDRFRKNDVRIFGSIDDRIKILVGLDDDVKSPYSRKSELDRDFDKMKFNSLYEKLTYRLEQMYEFIESVDMTSSEMMSLTNWVTPIREYEKAVANLETTYVLAKGHVRRMKNQATEVFDFPRSNWSIAGGLMKDVITSCEIGLYVNNLAYEIYGSETQKEFDNERDFVIEAIKWVAGDITKFEIKELIDNMLIISSPEKGQIIGRSGERIKLIENLIKKRIKLI